MACPHRANLYITREVQSTSTEIARERTELKCSLEAGHEGEHEDRERGERWADKGHELTTLIRHETE